MTAEEQGTDPVAGRCKWVALTNTTLGVLVVTIDSSIVIISLPAIFRGRPERSRRPRPGPGRRARGPIKRMRWPWKLPGWKRRCGAGGSWSRRTVPLSR